MEEKIIKILESIGMNKNEAKVYLDLSTNKPSLAKDITKRTKIHKANTYEAIKGLLSKGFIEEIIKENKRFFVALNPKVLIDYLHQREREVQEVISVIPTLPKKEIGEEEISLTKGIFSARNILLDLLTKHMEILSYSIPAKGSEFLGQWFVEDFHKSRIKEKIPMRLIYDENCAEQLKRLNRLPYTNARHSGLSYSSLSFIVLCGEEVMTFVLANPIMVIKIKNKDIAKSYRDYFEILWRNSKE